MTGDRAALMLARSLLDSAQIPYAITSDLAGDLFGWGRLGAAYNYVTGPARVLVNRDDADAARDILRDVSEPVSPAKPLWLLALVWIVLLGTAAQIVYAAVSAILTHLVRHPR